MTKKPFLLIFLSFFLFLAVPNLAQAQETGKFVLAPDKQSVSSGDKLTVKIDLETGTGNEVNSYQLDLTYPQDKLTFDSVKTEGSPFNMALEAKGGDGQVKIIRGTTSAQTGELLVGEVVFTAKSDVSASEIAVANTSAIIRSSDNSNILPGSVIQNDQDSAGNTNDQTSGSSDSSGGILGFFEMIKNFFLSFFK